MSELLQRRLDGVFLLGLAGVFLANAAVAVLDPDGFTELVAQSPAGWLLGSAARDWIAPAIALNDLAIGIAVLSVARRQRWRSPALAWAGAWLLVVTLVKVSAML
jgi:hypothetical protein